MNPTIQKFKWFLIGAVIGFIALWAVQNYKSSKPLKQIQKEIKTLTDTIQTKEAIRDSIHNEIDRGSLKPYVEKMPIPKPIIVRDTVYETMWDYINNPKEY
jgi:hypothetical protein